MTPGPSAAAASTSARGLFKNILRGSGMYSMTLVGQRLASIVTTPIVTRCLIPAEYGILELLDQIINLISLLLGGNFSAAMGYFYFKSNDLEQRRRVVGTSIFGAVLIGMAAALICWPWSGPLSHAFFHAGSTSPYLRLMFLSLPLTFALEALLVWLRLEDLTFIYVAGSLLRVGLSMAGVVFLVGFFQLRIYGMLYGMLVAAAVPVIWLGALCIRRVRPRFDAAAFGPMARFAAPIGVSGLAMFGINFGDRFFLTRYASLSELGVYALAYKIGMLISAVYSSFHTYWAAQVYAIMRRDDGRVIFGRLCTYVMLVLSACLVCLIACAKPLLYLLAPPSYSGAAGLIPLILAAYAVRSVGDFFRCLFAAHGRVGYDAICVCAGSAVCFGGYFLLIPRYHGWGAALATLGAFATVTSAVLVWTYRLERYELEKRRLLCIGIALAASLALDGAAPRAGFWGQVGWGALAVALFPALLWAMRFLSPSELEFGRTALRQLRGRLLTGL